MDQQLGSWCRLPWILQCHSGRLVLQDVPGLSSSSKIFKNGLCASAEATLSVPLISCLMQLSKHDLMSRRHSMDGLSSVMCSMTLAMTLTGQDMMALSSCFGFV